MGQMTRRTAGLIAASSGIAALTALAPAALALAPQRTVTHVNCNSIHARAHVALGCGVSVTTVAGGPAASAPTGVVSLATNVGAKHGTFSRGGTCTLMPRGRRTSVCFFTYTPNRAEATTIYANYRGDATHAASHGRTAITVRP